MKKIVYPIKAGKYSKLKYPWVLLGEFEDGYSTERGGNSEEDCMYKLLELEDRHGKLTWYGGLCDEDYSDGEFVGRENFIYD